MPRKKRPASPTSGDKNANPCVIPPEKVCTMEGFLRQFMEQHHRRPDQPFCFILGAGASRDSKIKTGGEMAMDWLKLLHEDGNHSGVPFEDWLRSGSTGIEGFDPEQPGRHYSQIYEIVYKDKDQAGFSYLESVMDGIKPSYGYSVLSYLLSETHHRIVITTNFDNLVTDSLAVHADSFPIVVNDDSLVHYVRANVHRPLVAKIHGSLGFKPKSKTEDLTLDERWRKALAAIFQTHTPVVIGYDGNDGSLMSLLLETPAAHPPEFVWWCYHCPDGSDPHATANRQPDHVRKLILQRPAQMVPIPGFDVLMAKLFTRFGQPSGKPAPDLVRRLEERTKERLATFKSQADELGKRLMSAPDGTAAATSPPQPLRPDPDMGDVLTLLAKSSPKKPWWQWQYEINALASPNEKDALYRQAITALPESPELCGNYANFLHTSGRNPDEAETYYQRAIETDPKNANNLGNYAVFLKDIRGNHDDAETYHQRAIEADPKHANSLGNYAVFLKNIRSKHDEAETYYKRAIEADPQNAVHLGNYANFLMNIRSKGDEAEFYYRRSIEADPKNATNLGNYASFLHTSGRNPDEAETYYQRAIKANPKHANNLGNYAVFLKNIRGKHDEAETYYIRAIEADPKNAAQVGNYANFLHTTGRNPDEAETYYQRAIEADSKNTNNLGNYANFLTGIRGKHDEAESYYQRAIEADPTDANNLGNYAIFLKNIRNNPDLAEIYYQRAIEADPKHANNLGNFGQFLLGKGETARGMENLRRAWEHLGDRASANGAEFALSLWLGSALGGAEEAAWLGSFRFCIAKGFKRHPWNFDAMLARAEKRLSPEDAAFAKALAAAFLDAAKVPDLEALPRWKAIKALDPSLVDPDGSVRQA